LAVKRARRERHAGGLFNELQSEVRLQLSRNEMCIKRRRD
jgi:hypothetical protein